jgi:anti-sigma28 factor (negative regulator of flagellin synthesis)
MRIQPSDKSLGVEPASPAQPDTAAARSKSAGADRVELSALSQTAAGLAPQRLEEIQASVHAGTYEANAAEVARRIVNFYLIPVK